MKCSEMKMTTLYDKCVGKYVKDEQFMIIPAGLRAPDEDGTIRRTSHRRIVNKCLYDYLLNDDLSRGDIWNNCNDKRGRSIDENIKYEYCIGLGEVIIEDFTVEENDQIMFVDTIIKGFSEFLWLLRFKAHTRATFGKPLRVVCFNHEWIIEAHGDILALINMTPPLRYMTSFLRLDDIRKDSNNLKTFIREIITTSINYYHCNRYGDWFGDEDFILGPWCMNYFYECIEQEEGNEGISEDECYNMIKNEVMNVYNICLEFDFENCKRSKDFYEIVRKNDLLKIEAPHLKEDY